MAEANGGGIVTSKVVVPVFLVLFSGVVSVAAHLLWGEIIEAKELAANAATVANQNLMAHVERKYTNERQDEAIKALTENLSKYQAVMNKFLAWQEEMIRNDQGMHPNKQLNQRILELQSDIENLRREINQIPATLEPRKR